MLGIRHSLRALEKFRHFLPFFQFHVSLLPVGALSREASLALDLAVRDRRAHAFDLRAEQFFDRVADIDLGGVGRHFEDQRPSILAEERRLLGDDRPADDVCEFHSVTQATLAISPGPRESRSASSYPSRRAR